MTVRNLDALFVPASVRQIESLTAASSHDNAPCLALLRAPREEWASMVTSLGAAGTRAVILADSGTPGDGSVAHGCACDPHLAGALRAARPFLLRVLGPGDAGIATPRIGLYVGFASSLAEPTGAASAAATGSPSQEGAPRGMAWVCQSGRMAQQAMDFASTRGLRLSSVVALGDESDIDCGDVLDYLASDPATLAVMICVDHVRAARKFMSAARACVRNKPVFISCDPAAGENHLAYDAAFERAGFVRLADIDALLEALATLQSPQVSGSDLMKRYRIARERLAQTPPSLPLHHAKLRDALAWVHRRLSDTPGHAGHILNEDDALSLLAHFGIPVQPRTPGMAQGDAANTPSFTVTLRDDRTFGPFLEFTTADGHASSALLPINAALACTALEQLAHLAASPAGEFSAGIETLAAVSLCLCSVEAICALSAQLCVVEGQAVLHPITIQLSAPGTRRPLAIRPYPVELEESIEWDGRCLTIRPIRPEDEHAHAEFFHAMTPEDLRLRFFAVTRQPDHTQLARYVQIDYDREMAFVACTEEGGSTVIHGVVRAVCDPDNETAEFAVTVRSDETGHHLGRMLMDRIIEYCRARGTRVMTGEILRENTRMLKLAFDCGFVVQPGDDFEVTSVRRVLNA
jgi:GNAT superfamily N-acetyltransferase